MASMCRICFEEDGEFLRPCKCKGSMATIHAHCWEKQDFHCGICKYTKANTVSPEVKYMEGRILYHRASWLFSPKIIVDDITQFLYYLVPCVSLFHLPFSSVAAVTTALFLPRYFWPIMKRRGWRKNLYLAFILFAGQHSSISIMSFAALKRSLIIDVCLQLTFRLLCTFMMYTTIGLEMMSLTWSQLAKHNVL